jgi:hypothetical protein
MPSVTILSTSVLSVAVCAEAAVIFVLVLMLWRVAVVGARYLRQRDRARRERNEARQTLALIRRMSEIRVETVTRLRGFIQEP